MKKIISVILFILIALPVWAITMQGSDGGTIQGGSAKMQGGGFSPLSLAPVAWYDASSSASFTFNGANVSQWNDISGNGNHLTQATAVDQPLYNSASPATVEFDGVSEFMQGPAFTQGVIAQPFTIVCVSQNITLATQTVYVDSIDGTNDALVYEISGFDRMFAGGVDVMDGNASTLNKQMLATVFNGDSSLFYTNTSAGPDTSSQAGEPGSNSLGGVTLSAFNSGLSGYRNQKIHAVLIVDRELTVSELDQLGNYYQQRYGNVWIPSS